MTTHIKDDFGNDWWFEGSAEECPPADNKTYYQKLNGVMTEVSPPEAQLSTLYSNAIARAEKAEEALRVAGWQPIYTAPKDGREIVCLDEKTGTMHVSHFETGENWYDPDRHYYSETPDFVPTLWVALPPPPPPVRETP